MSLNVVCLMKQTFATEAKIALEGNGSVSREKVKEVINPYDEFAIEEAVLWAEAGRAGKVTILALGEEKAISESVRRGLAMGADEAVVIDTTGVPADQIDESVVATALAKQLGAMSFDVVMCGKVAVDSNAMEVPSRVSAALDIPFISIVGKAGIEGGKLVAEREADGRKEFVEAMLPAMFSADKSLNRPRYPNLPSIMKAKKKPLLVVKLQDVLGGAPQPTRRVVSRRLPEKKGDCRFIGGTPAEAAAELVRVLREEARVIH